MNVLVLPSLYSHPGHDRCGSFVRDQVQALTGAGTNVTVAYVEPRRLKQFSVRALRESHWQTAVVDDNGITTVRQKGWNPFLGTTVGGRIWARLLERLVLHKVSNLGQFDLIHAHNAAFAGVAARRLSQRLRIPYVVTEHASAFLMGTVTPGEERMARLVYRDAAAVITVSSALARAIGAFTSSCDPRVIPNGVDFDYFSPASARPNCDRFHVFAGGNLTANKGYDVLIRAFAAAFPNTSECHLTLMGDGAERASLERTATILGIRERVRFTGAILRDQVREYMRNADVFVISSYHETFGIVAVEAIASAVPVIATKCGGPEDVVTPEVGRLVRPGSVEEMREALVAARADRIDVRSARDVFSARFSMPAVAEKVANIYSQVSGKPIK